MNPFLLVDGSPPTVLRLDLIPSVAEAAKNLFLSEALRFDEEIDDYIPFDAGYKPNIHECFEVPNFTLPDPILEVCRNPLAAQRVNADELGTLPIRGVIGYDGFRPGGTPKVIFQNFSSSRIMVPGRKLTILSAADRHTFRQLDSTTLQLDGKVTMTWQASTLRFKSFNMAQRILDLSSLFTEATDAQIETFAGNAMLHCQDTPALVAACSSWHKTKISMLTRSGKLDAPNRLTRIIAHAASINYVLPMENGRIVLPTNRKQLRELLQVLDEDVFMGGISNERYLSSAKRVLDAPDVQIEPAAENANGEVHPA